MKRYFWTALIALIAFASSGAQLSITSGLLPSGGTWTNVGVVGGIPNVTTIYTNLSPSGNTLTDWTNMETAVLLCPSNQVVYLNAGTYYIPNRGISWGTVGSGGWLPIAGHSGVVLRGAGMGKTILSLADGAAVTIQGNYATEDMTNMMYRWTSGYTQGTTNITIGTNFLGGSATGLTNGDLIMLTQENDTNLVTIQSNEGQPAIGLLSGSDAWGGDCNELQWVRVTSVSNGTNLTIWPGVYMTNYQSSLRPLIYWNGTHTVTEMCGLEEMTVNNPTLSLSISGLSIYYSYNCWAKDVEFGSPGYSAVSVNRAAHCTMESCYAHDSASGGAAVSYGGYAGSSSDCLYQNNIFAQITSPILFQDGTSGCVAGYNLATNGIFGINPDWMPNALNVHGAHCSMNLFEGNVAVSFAPDIIHGSASHNIAIRNYLSGWQTNKIYNTLPIAFNAWNRHCSLVGNVFGKEGFHTNYESTALTYPTNFNNLQTIYTLGFMGNDFNGSNSDALTVTTLWREGNYDYATHSTIWDGNGVKTLPSSLYLTSKPSWWGSSAWPSIGSDLTPMVGTIPAQTRFDAMFIPSAVLGGIGTGGGGTFGSWGTQ